MSKNKINIWGRDFDLPILYECYDGQEVEPEQKEEAHRLLTTPGAFQDVTNVKNYIIKNNSKDVGTEIDNIFKYVIPTKLFVKRANKKHQNIVALLCNYRFDPEHGLAVLYKNGEVYKVGSQDIAL